MNKTTARIKRNTKIKWKSRGPLGTMNRTGVVKGFIPAGTPVKLPKSADPAKFKAGVINKIHDRYLVEIVRLNQKTGKKMSSHWLAPKAATMHSKDSRLKIVG